MLQTKHDLFFPLQLYLFVTLDTSQALYNSVWSTTQSSCFYMIVQFKEHLIHLCLSKLFNYNHFWWILVT